MNQELKQQAHKEFDERFPCKCKICKLEGVNTFGECFCSYSKSTHIWERPEIIKSFIDSLIDKTVQMTEGRIVENIIENLKKHIEESETELKKLEGEDCEITKDYKLAIENIMTMLKSLITNKSDINKGEEHYH